MVSNLDDPIYPGMVVEWTITLRQRDGTPPQAGMVTAYRAYSRSPVGVVTSLVATALPTIGMYRLTCQFDTGGDWYVRFETDGIETAHERYYHVLPSAFPSPG